MKGIAICAMLCHHLYACPPEGVEPYSGVLHWIGVLGKVCVALFLFCSGYGLAASYTPISVIEDLKFIGRRLVKFYLNYWVIFLIFVPITVFVFHRPLYAAYGENNVWLNLILDVFGMQGFDSYNITWWFNKLIITLYLLFPMLYRLVKIQPWIVLLIGFALMRFESHMPGSYVKILTWQNSFVLGLFWKLSEHKGLSVQEWIVKHNVLSIGISFILLIGIIIIRMYPIIPHWGGTRIDGFLSCAIALSVFFILRPLKHVKNVFAYLGKHSINIYLIHSFFNGLWCPEWLHAGEWLRGGGNFAILMLICLAISIGIECAKNKLGLYKLMNTITKK